jgi:hypothetical protein
MLPEREPVIEVARRKHSKIKPIMVVPFEQWACAGIIAVVALIAVKKR